MRDLHLSIRPEHAETVAKIVAGMEAGGLLVLRREDDAAATVPTAASCGLCGELYDRHALRPRIPAGLPDDACPLCCEAGQRIEERFRTDARRHLADFNREFASMVRAVRSGADEPTFYRGLE